MRQRIASLLNFSQAPVEVDENNNEVGQVPSRSSSRVGKVSFGIVVVAASLVLAALLQGVKAGVAESASHQMKLRQIRELSASSGLDSANWIPKSQTNQQDPEVCYDDGCLDAAFDILHAANLSINPCDDFFQFACGRWLASNPVPPSASRWSRFNGLRDEVNRITQEILTESENPNDAIPVNQVKEFYSECINTAKLETPGVTPIIRLIGEFGGWPLLNPGNWSEETFDWTESIGELRRRLLDDAVISIYIERDFKNTSRNVVFLDQPSFGLPRGVLIDAPSYESLIAAYRTFIVEVAQELGTSQTAAQLQEAAQAIIDLEIKLANISISEEDRYDVDSIYNLYLLNEFQALTDGLNPTFKVEWQKLLNQVFSSSGVSITEDDIVNVAGQPYLLELIPILSTASQKVIADYVGWRVASGVLGSTTQKMRDIAFKFTQALTGAKEPSTRESSCAGSANNNFGMAVGVKYIEAAFDIEAKGLVDELVENLRVSFKELVDEADWMADETKVEARAKADAIRSFMAFPEWLENATAVNEYFAGLRLVTGVEAHFQSVLALALWSSDKTLAELRLPTTKDEWLTYPGVVNAFYSPQHNSITFPAGILQPPFFGKTRPKSQNYGGIGVVIGHEITHGFDNQGSQFDKDGNAFNWWDDETKEKYNEKTKCIVDQYSDFYIPSIDMNVNGDLTQGENIADNGGLRESFKAYRKYVEELGKEEGRLPGLEQLSGNQLFFLGYANIWCESITDEGLVNQIITDPHSPAQFRVTGPLRNNVDFATAYDCPVSDDGMNPPLGDKCTVW